jgi:hypothetical protein
MDIMTLGQFREATDHLPGDTQIMVENEEALKFFSMHILYVLPPVLDHPSLLLFECGQSWNYELDIDMRIDARHHGLGLD